MASFWEVFFGTFPNLAKKAGPHETLVNSMQIEGRAPRKTSKKPPENDRKNDMKTKTGKGGILEAFCLHFGRLGAPFWNQKALQKSSEILDAFLEAKREFH